MRRRGGFAGGGEDQAVTNVIVIRAFDNFMYLHPCGDGSAFAIDPGDAAAVSRALDEHGLTLAAILVTHHHWDHVGGVADLQSKTKCEVIGVDRALIPASDRTVTDGDVLTVGDVTIDVIATPGHTRTSVCYHIPASDSRHGVAYTGDTLFVGGCGRLLECDAATMWRSLQKLAALPDETLVYCGHDYTLENYEFAASIDPANRRFRERLAEVHKTVEYGRLTVPSTIAQEKAANIFLQADHPQIQTALGMAGAQPEEVFAELRRRKDLFG
ncbi:MAG: hydroxyacylglutathione hydrolase [Planctomycetes bacterium RBG_13_60_9]|nr:MAG: hydroxyacylglutathione hydrolase [Planctomycetes bacterium RBG_13_60_9]